MCRRKAAINAAIASLRTLERCCFGPVLRSSTISRQRHFARVFRLISNSRLNALAKLAIAVLLLGRRVWS